MQPSCLAMRTWTSPSGASNTRTGFNLIDGVFERILRRRLVLLSVELVSEPKPEVPALDGIGLFVLMDWHRDESLSFGCVEARTVFHQIDELFSLGVLGLGFVVAVVEFFSLGVNSHGFVLGQG